MCLKHYIVFLFLFAYTIVYAQQPLSNFYQRPESQAAYPFTTFYFFNQSRLPLYLPEIDEYVLLKCDFHLHTVFSDGSVWPVSRVEEAFREGLDAIAITDHIEYRHINKDINALENYNREYEIAKSAADNLGVLLVPGLEVTREYPVGHYNMLFIDDANPLAKHINHDNPYDTTAIVDILSAGKAMGAFTFWNHPAFPNPNGIAQWNSVQQNLYEKGLLMGIELINTGLHIPLVHQWADEKGLTILANTDAHGALLLRDGSYRSMTIVFARDRSIASIREALFAKRTIGYAHNYLYGKEELLKSIFEKSLKTRILRSTDKEIALEIRNLTGLPFELEFIDDNHFVPPTYFNYKFVLYGNETIAVALQKKNAASQSKEISVVVNNLHVKASTPLKTTIKF